MTEPTLEEMKKAVLDAMPGSQEVSDGRHGYYAYSKIEWEGIIVGTGRAIKESDAHDDAWRDAYSKLPKKPAPESVSVRPSFVSEEYRKNLAEKGIEVEGFPASPESEDEAFERWRRTYEFERASVPIYVDGLELGDISDFARVVWHARARLSAGGK